MNRKEGRHLLRLARITLHLFLERQETYVPDATALPAALLEPASTFVTLRHGERLRGCIGSTHAQLPVYQDVVRNTIAAMSDPRFDPVTVEELPEIRIELSLLGALKKLHYDNFEDLLSHLRPDIDGVIVSWQEQRGLLLPQVWERFPQPQQFMQALCYKANIPWHTLSLKPPQVEVVTFEVACFADSGETEDELPDGAAGEGRA